jgi:hypothetical protein
MQRSALRMAFKNQKENGLFDAEGIPKRSLGTREKKMGYSTRSVEEGIPKRSLGTRNIV